eukprot:358286-Chlamydomonas_euryale.AAC.3
MPAPPRRHTTNVLAGRLQQRCPCRGGKEGFAPLIRRRSAAAGLASFDRPGMRRVFASCGGVQGFGLRAAAAARCDAFASRHGPGTLRGMNACCDETMGYVQQPATDVWAKRC